jgi:hypothetical protein
MKSLSILSKRQTGSMLCDLSTKYLPLFTGLVCLSSVFQQNLQAQNDRVVLTPSDGFSISWNGNNGAFNDPFPGGLVPDNEALSFYGTFAFASSNFQPGGFHDAINVNDGFYSNSSSWIADFTADPPDENPYIALAFNREVQMTSIAWSRDNGDDAESTPAGPFTDRAVGVYTLQYTQVSAPSESTDETGSPASGWATFATVEYLDGPDTNFFADYLRHRFEVSTEGGAPISATGFRILVSDVNIAIDEIEVNPDPDPNPPLSDFLFIVSEENYQVSWDGNEGGLNDGSSGVISNAALHEEVSAFSSSGMESLIRDGLYGDSNAWSPASDGSDPNPFVGVAFPRVTAIRNLAWGRDNTAFQFGKALGNYQIQITRVANPDASTEATGDPATGWVNAGEVQYRMAGAEFTSELRHRFEIATALGGPVFATGVRLVLSTDQIVIDELEVNVNLAVEQNLVRLEPGFGYSISWDGNDGDYFSPLAEALSPENEAWTEKGSEAFGSSELGLNTHFITNVNDGLYGNASSWISETGLAPDEFIEEFVGVRFNRTVEIESIAWGRDNGNNATDCCGGQLTDRAIGSYVIQVTQIENPGADTFESGDSTTGWETLATVYFDGGAPPDFNTHLRHRFDVSQNGSPISATAMRIKVSPSSIAIDEIEINPVPAPEEQPVSLNAEFPYALEWDGNSGLFSSPEPDAKTPPHSALASNGATAFASSELGLNTHFAHNVIDGQYGNASSWIADFINGDSDPYVGVRFASAVPLQSIAWSRDNGNDSESTPPGSFTDRSIGKYTIQFTRVSAPGTDTQVTQDPETGWVDLGSVDYAAVSFPFDHHLRHRFEVNQDGSPVDATGIRILVSDPNIAIDEIEVNPIENLIIQPQSGFTIEWDGREGDFYFTETPAPAPENIALASMGSLAFASTQLDLGVHFTQNVNDGFYGNSSSWIADFINGDIEPFVGVTFPGLTAIESIAWGRDNGDNPNDCCGGQLTDRAIGEYTLQFTTVPSPDPFQSESEDPSSGWSSIGVVSYTSGPSSFRPWLRHRFHLGSEAGALEATAIRIKVSDANTAIDEIEINTPSSVVEPESMLLTLTPAGDGIEISWEGSGVLNSSENIGGPWSPVDGASSPYQLQDFSGAQMFFRLFAP